MRDSIIRGWRQPQLLNYLLLPVAWLYQFLSAIRHSAYRSGLLRSYRLPVPVLVAGGITAGGSGKTPLVIELVNHLKETGFNPGVISRGYGGKSTFWPRQVGDDTSAELVGDEPQLIRDRCQVPVVVGPDRIRSGRFLLDRCSCDVIVSDDGFQHFAIKRDLDLVVIDGESGVGNGWCLPSGPLREPVSGLARADVVVINGDKRFHTPLPIHTFKMHSRLANAFNLVSGENRSLQEFLGEPVCAMAAIGNPARFFAQLEEAGLDLDSLPFPDHHYYSEQDFAKVGKRAVMMTEKDGIKCKAMKSQPFAKNIWVITTTVTVDTDVFAAVDKVVGKGNRNE